jgi:hypothetical protein
MALSTRKPLLLAMLITGTLWLPATPERRVMEVFFNDREKQFYIDRIQRCYTIAYCFNDESRNCKWNNLPEGSQMVWFSDRQCQGKSLYSRLTKGTTNFEGTKLYKKVSSFMVCENNAVVMVLQRSTTKVKALCSI